MTISLTDRLAHARRLGFWGLVSRWDEVSGEPWLLPLLDSELAARQHRSLERRLAHAKLGTFKSMADFQWHWPTKIDRDLLAELFTFQFVRDAANVILVGANGLGKTLIAQNLAYQAILQGMTVGFTTASAMLNDLAAQDGTLSFQRRLARYTRPQLLVIDEIGYLDTRMFYHVDADYCKRIADAGYFCYYLPSATVIHLNHKGGTMVSPRLRVRSLLSFHIDCYVYYCKHLQRWRRWSPMRPMVIAALALQFLVLLAAQVPRELVGATRSFWRQRQRPD